MDILELYDIADKNGIYIIDFDLPKAKSCLLMDTTDKTYYIGIDKNQISKIEEQKVQIAIKIGYCLVNKENTKQTQEAMKKQATKWAIEQLIPKDELRKLMQDPKTNQEIKKLSNEFKVTEEFMIKARLHYDL